MTSFLSVANTLAIASAADAYGVVEKPGLAHYWTAASGDVANPGAKQNHIRNPKNIIYNEALKAITLMPTLVKTPEVAPPHDIYAGTWRVTTSMDGIRYLRKVEAKLTLSDAVSGNSLPANPIFQARVQRANLPFTPGWGANTNYKAGAIVHAMARSSFHFYQAVADLTSGSTEPVWNNTPTTPVTTSPMAWPPTVGGDTADGTGSWKEVHEAWEVLWGGVDIPTGKTSWHVLQWNRLGNVRILWRSYDFGDQTTITDEVILKEYQVPDSEVGKFGQEQMLDWVICCQSKRIFITCDKIKGVIQADMGGGLDCIPANYPSYHAYSGDYACNVSPYKFAESGSFDTDYLVTPRGGTGDLPTFASWPASTLDISNTNLNGTVTITENPAPSPAPKPGTALYGKKSYHVLLTPPTGDTAHTPFIQAVDIQYAPVITANGDTPPVYEEALDNTRWVDISHLMDLASSEVKAVSQLDPGARVVDVVLNLTGDCYDQVFDSSNVPRSIALQHLVYTLQSGLPLEYISGRILKPVAVKIGIGYNHLLDNGTTQTVSPNLFGLMTAGDDGNTYGSKHALALKAYDRFAYHFNAQAAKCPPVFGLTVSDAITKLATWAGVRETDIVLTPYISPPGGSNAAQTIPDPGWGYDKPSYIPLQTDMLGDFLRRLGKDFNVSMAFSASDGKLYINDLAIADDVGDWQESHYYQRGAAIYQGGHWWEADQAGTSGATSPTWPAENTMNVSDGGITWFRVLEWLGDINTNTPAAGHHSVRSDGGGVNHMLIYGQDVDGNALSTERGYADYTGETLRRTESVDVKNVCAAVIGADGTSDGGQTALEREADRLWRTRKRDVLTVTATFKQLEKLIAVASGMPAPGDKVVGIDSANPDGHSILFQVTEVTLDCSTVNACSIVFQQIGEATTTI